jgi:uncharacterized protein YwqG
MNDFLKQVTENRKHLSFDSAEEKAYFALADYYINPPDFDKLRSEITHYEYSKGGLTFGGIYRPSLFAHILVVNSRGKRCTERAAYNFQYGFDKNDNLIYIKRINIETEFGYTEWVSEQWNIITPDEIRSYEFQINGPDGPQNRFDYFRLITIEDGKIKSNVFVYSADRILDYEHFHTETEYYNYENDEIVTIDETYYTQFLIGHIMSGKDMGILRTHEDIKPEKRISSDKAFELFGLRGMSAVSADDIPIQSEDNMNKEKADVLYRIIQKYITEKFISETKKTAVRLKATRGKTKAKETKFGGKPYIPKGFSYPRINGEPMVLICQLNFAEIPHLDGYPESGLLQVYLEYDETAMFMPESYKIVFHSDISGKNCYKNPFGDMKKSSASTGFVDYFSGMINYDADEIGKISELFLKSSKLLINDNQRFQKLLDELAASYVEYREFDETKFYPISKEDNAIIKSFRECTEYLNENKDAPDAQPIAKFIDNIFFGKKETSSFSDDILPLNPDREYKIKAELFEVPFTPEIDGFYEVFLQKFTAFFAENKDFVSSEIEREVINEFLEMQKNDNSPDPSKLLFDIFPYGEYDYIFESLSASSLDEYDKYGACLVGGFPHFTQGDYRPEGYSELLLQIDSFDYSDGYENTVMWGDGGVINFFIKPENLKNADFSDIYIGGDCS